MFCNKCGSVLQPGMAFCPKCGNPTGAVSSGEYTKPESTESPEIPKSPGNSEISESRQFTVTFVRENQRFAVNPAVSITVDERDEYRIDNGQTIRVPMAPGTHSVVFRCGIRNKVIDLTVRQDLTLELKWNRLTGSLTVKTSP